MFRDISTQSKVFGIGLATIVMSFFCLGATSADRAPQTHIGQDLPDYITGDECLFCHRNDIGRGWPVNAHQLTMRPINAVPKILDQIKEQRGLKPFASQIRFVLGYETQIRLLKKSNEYGKLKLLSAKLTPAPDSDGEEDDTLIASGKNPFHWEDKTFAQQCAGCHTTGVDSRTQSFSATGIDCYACHGDVDLEHTNDTSLVHLSKERMNKPELVSRTCAQCHIRSGRSRASGLPYPNNYVTGDDLYADFEVDLSEPTLRKAPPRERHILQSIKKTTSGHQSETCLSCHNIHRSSGRKHRRVPKNEDCFICHRPTTMKLTYDRNEKHHALCGY